MNDERVKFCVFRDFDNQLMSEDFSFCVMARLCGYKPMVDPHVLCQHWRRNGHFEIDEIGEPESIIVKGKRGFKYDVNVRKLEA